MNGLAEFLLARFAEEKAVALAATPGPWAWDSDGDLVSTEGEHLTVLSGTVYMDIPYLGLDAEPADAQHIAHWDPARVLADCEARARIVERYMSLRGLGSYKLEERLTLGDVLRLFATLYVDHPDFRAEWRP